MKHFRVLIFIIITALLLLPSESFAWAYQGHILMTRLAVLRIINDPAAPAGLRDFLRANMPFSMADCQKLAESQTVGIHPEKSPEFNNGLDKWCVMPDRIRFMPDAREPVEPYDVPEGSLHFLDLEAFGKTFDYKDDLSNKPDVMKIPHDLSDPRWKRGGYVPWRVEEMYNDFRVEVPLVKGDDRRQAAVRAVGFMAHYFEDSTQPHHATSDYKSLSYLLGHIPQMPATTQPATATLEKMRAPKGVDPHGNIEFSLFENDQPPLKAFREQYWQSLIGYLKTLPRPNPPLNADGTLDAFRWDLEILSDSYEDLPFVGHAAQAGYAMGTFDPKAFFGFQGKVHGQEMTMAQFIAYQNAKSVLDVEYAIRSAWAAGAIAPVTPSTLPSSK